MPDLDKPKLDKPKLPKGWKLDEELYLDPEGKTYTQAQFDELVKMGVVDLPEDLIEPEFVSTDIGRIPRTGFVSELEAGYPDVPTLRELYEKYQHPSQRFEEPEPYYEVSEDINQFLIDMGYEEEPIFGQYPVEVTEYGYLKKNFDVLIASLEEELATQEGMTLEELKESYKHPEARFRDIQDEIDSLRIEKVLTEMYPYFDPVRITTIIQNNQEAFLNRLRRMGRSEDTIALIRGLFGDIGEEQIDEFFEGGWFAEEPTVEDWYYQRLGEIFPEVGEITSSKVMSLFREGTREQKEAVLQLSKEYRARKEPVWKRQIGAGIGDIIASLGGLANWMGAEGIAKNLQDEARKAQAIAPVLDPLEFTWDSIFTGKFWSGFSMQALRALPFTLALLPTAFIGAAALIPVGVAVAARTTLGVFGQSVLKTIFGAAGAGTAARFSESALEAGSAYDRAIQGGMSSEEASSVASRVFYQNLTLAGVDIAQFITAFMPINPAGALTRLIGRGWVRVVVTGGKITGVALTEAGEEGVQELITRSALGEEIAWDDEMKMAVAIGGSMGAPFGAAGSLLTKVTDTTIQSLPPEVKADISVAIENLEKQGVVGETAKIIALDEVGGKEIVQNAEIATEQAKIAEIEKIEPKTKADKIVLDQRIAKMKADVTSLPGFERVLQAQLQIEKFIEMRVRAEVVQPIWTITKRVGGEAATWESGNAIIERGKAKTGKGIRYIARVEGVTKEYAALTLENAQKWVRKQSEYQSPIMPKGKGAPVEGRVNAPGETVRMVGKYEIMLDEEGNIVICG